MKSIFKILALAVCLIATQSLLAQKTPTKGTTTTSTTNTTTPQSRVQFTDTRNGDIIVGTDLEETCASWEAGAKERMTAEEFAIMKDRYKCEDMPSGGSRVQFAVSPCVKRWIDAQHFTKAQFVDMVVTRSANPTKWDNEHCMAEEMATPIKKKTN